jgi:hypothetical protein
MVAHLVAVLARIKQVVAAAAPEQQDFQVTPVGEDQEVLA